MNDFYGNHNRHSGHAGVPFVAYVEAQSQMGHAVYETFGSLARAVRKFAQAVQRMHSERKTYHALARLDDRTLQDIGLSRSDISSVARKTAEAKASDYRVSVW